MKRLCYLMMFFLFLFCSQANGQKKSSKLRMFVTSTEDYIRQAKAVQSKDPVKAIELLQLAITNESTKKRSNYTTEIYFILGNIYEQTKQWDLADQRYLVALNSADKGQFNLKAEIFYRLGLIHTETNNEKQAFSDFNYCINTTNLDSLSVRCYEGIVDLHLTLNNNAAAISTIDKIEKEYNLDKIEIARIQARKSQAYVQLKEYDSAANALQNSYDNLPRGTVIPLEDIAPSQRANDQLLNSQDISNIKKIEIQSNIDYGDLNDNDPVKENLRQAQLHKDENDDEKYELALVEAKNNIKINTDPDLAAETYKQSYEYNLDQGKISKAFEDLEGFIANKEKAIVALETRLKNEIEILKGQKVIDLNQKDIEIEQKENDLLAGQVSRQKIIISFLSLILLASGIFFYFLNKNIKEKRKANQMLYLKSLRTQMNPHFIFNALNSVNNFIAKNDEKTANLFLSDFSRLMRKVLDYSQKDFISFSDEVELNELYLKLEQFRFRDKFEYQFQNDLDGNNETEIPPMLIQPFIENAVWHGLRYKEDKGLLKLLIQDEADKIVVNIQDNGIGRTKSKSLKTKNQQQYNSTGLDNVSKRVALINELYDKNYLVEVTDLHPNEENTGTNVKISIPKA